MHENVRIVDDGEDVLRRNDPFREAIHLLEISLASMS